MNFSKHYKTIDKIIDWFGLYGILLSLLIVGMVIGAFLTFATVAGVFWSFEYQAIYYNGMTELNIPIAMQNLPSIDTILLFMHTGEFLIYFIFTGTIIAVVSLVLFTAKFLWNHKKIQSMITKIRRMEIKYG
jgi:hypothetical protein